MSLINQVRIHHKIAEVDGVPVRFVNEHGNFCGGILATTPDDDLITCVGVTQEMLNLMDVDEMAFVGMIYHEVGHIKNGHISIDKGGVILNQQKEIMADSYALQYVSKEDLARGLKACAKITAAASRKRSLILGVLTKIEIFFRMNHRLANLGKCQIGEKRKISFNFTKNVIDHLTSLNICIPFSN